MKYKNMFVGSFIDRPNRFIAKVEINKKIETVHVKNTGRCKEILRPGCQIFLEKSDKIGRKTQFDLISVIKKRNENENLIINIDSQAPNVVVAEWLGTAKGKIFIEKVIKSQKKVEMKEIKMLKIISVRREVCFGRSRLDFVVDLDVDGESRQLFIEVKGVTLEKNGVAYFPDAPTERGVKHILELEEITKNGNFACILFVIQMKGISEFRPNDETHAEFGVSLRKAGAKGVCVEAVDCLVTPDSIEIDEKVKVVLNR